MTGRMTVEKSNGHITFHGSYEYYQDANGDLFVAPISNVIDCTTGYRIGRWECYAHHREYVLSTLTP